MNAKSACTILLALLLLLATGAAAQDVKQDFDLSRTQWSYDDAKPFIYDGTQREVVLLGLPEGLTVAQYVDNRGTLPGERRARAVFSFDAARYNPPAVSPLFWRILAPPPVKMQLTVKAEGVQILWTKPPHADGVEIHRSPLGKNRFERVYFGRDAGFLDRSAAQGQGYVYCMRTYVAQSVFLGLYHYSDFGPPHTLALLGKPEGLQARRLAKDAGLVLTWDPVPGAEGYLVTREHLKEGQQAAPHRFDPVFEPAYTDRLPLTGETAYYRVAACLMGKEGPVPGPDSAWLCVSLAPDTGIPGDANNDGRVDPLDLISLSDYLARRIPCPSMGNADANGSGGEPDLVDLVYIANLIVGH